MKPLQYNEKPTAINNIGEDISGASRHRFNTYTDEQKEERERSKSQKKEKDTLKADYQALLDPVHSIEQLRFILKEYELKIACKKIGFLAATPDELKQHVLKNRSRDNVNAFNKFYRVHHRIQFKSMDELLNYFKSSKKEAYNHVTGISQSWKTSNSLLPNAIGFLSSQVKAIQFGNSLTENERIFNLNELSKGIEELKEFVNFDFSKVAFSFGARGRPGSVAHYQDSAKVIAINRNRCGSIVHELGHAIDYSQDLVSRQLPAELVSRYRMKVYADPALKKQARYLLDRKEIFARFFESYMSTKINNAYLLDGDRSDWPELTESDHEWMRAVLS